ncbi:GNAT family N-acetyltransferase [Streptomyces sp. H39-S7]|uniref:GNAT family N-acetyltransferase n=1 Tax=Streptomyces sp. H39-S7 TaxID=3004357 RepID=UPI0022AEC12B|nr:GNAT family N-acetyltransferase [Streptomyces sp. H39-S7]MCZ4119956.1 GNAT family N-acetyltransferase [Streptomyces sp. H39-S7]
MASPELQRIRAFLSAFARRQAARTVVLPGGFAALDDTFAHSRGNNFVVIDQTSVDPETLPALADEALGHLSHRMIAVFDDEFGTVCAEPLIRAGYSHSADLIMLHTGPLPVAGGAEEVDLDTLRVPLTRRWHNFLPDVNDEVIRHLVDRRDTRRRGADVVQFIGARAEDGEVASWADLYLDPAAGIAQIEDLVTSERHLGRGYANAVLATALSRAGDADCGTRFLIADSGDWPRHWYERHGFTPIGHSHCFERA